MRLLKKKIIILFAEHVHIIIKRVGWFVTNIHDHYTFIQSKLKKDFVVANQHFCQKASNSIEINFYKILNDNFEIGCCDNMDDCILEPLYDDLDEISYIKKFATISNYDTFKYFLSKDMKEKIVQTFQEKISALNKNDWTY